MAGVFTGAGGTLFEAFQSPIEAPALRHTAFLVFALLFFLLPIALFVVGRTFFTRRITHPDELAQSVGAVWGRMGAYFVAAILTMILGGFILWT